MNRARTQLTIFHPYCFFQAQLIFFRSGLKILPGSSPRVYYYINWSYVTNFMKRTVNSINSGFPFAQNRSSPSTIWFPTVIQGLSWMQCLTLTTIQKVAPIILASYTITELNPLLITLIASISSRVIGSLGGLNQTLLHKILAYSSVNHIAGMLAAISIRIDTWILYILIYSLVSLSLIAILNFNQMFHFKQISTIPQPGAKILSFLTLLSLGGLPLLIGFVPKLIIIKLLAETQNFIWLSILIMGTLLKLFYYIRLSITAIVIFTPRFKTFFPRTSLLSLTLIFPYINFFTLLFPMIIPLIY